MLFQTWGLCFCACGSVGFSCRHSCCVGLLTNCASHHWLKLSSGPITKMCCFVFVLFWFFVLILLCFSTCVYFSSCLKSCMSCHCTQNALVSFTSHHYWALYKFNFTIKGRQSILPAGWKKSVSYILNYVRPSAWGVSLPSVIYLYILLFEVYALLRSRIYIFMLKTFYFWDSSWLYSIQLELRENWKM